MYLGSTYEAIAALQDAETEVLRPTLEEAEAARAAANEARRVELVEAARESYQAWK